MYKKSTRVNRWFNHLLTSIKTVFHERRFAGFDTRIKYMFFEEKESDTLVVVFPACSPNSARYNYVRTLQSVKCNKLFLLDDFASNHQGCYFISPNEEKCAMSLIENIIDSCKKASGSQPSNILFVGSSKGAYMALNMSFEIPRTKLIIGSPKYFLGTNLNKSDTLINLKFLIGDPITDEGIKQLDSRLRNKVLHSRIKPELIYFHYSNVEHTYEEHVKYLLDDLKKASIPVIEDIHDYPQHGGLKDYFPPFLVNTVKGIIKE